MDKKSFILFLLISALIMVGWYLGVSLVFGKRLAQRAGEPPRPTTPGGEEPQAGEPPQSQQPSLTQAPAGQVPEGDQQAEAGPKIEEVHGLCLRNEVIEACWTNRGAALESLTLLRYRAPYFEEGGKERPLLELVRDFQEGCYSDVIEAVTFLPPPGDEKAWRQDIPAADVLYTVDRSAEGEGRLVFDAALDARLAVRKTVTVQPGKYHYDVVLELINRTQEPLRFSYRLRGPAGIERETLEGSLLASVVGLREGSRYSVSQVPAAALRKGNRLNESAGILWAGMLSQYFVALVQPQRPDWIRAVESRLLVETDIAEGRGRWGPGSMPKSRDSRRAEVARSNATAVILSTEVSLGPSESLTHAYQLVGAPVLGEVLEPYGAGITNALRSGAQHWMTQLLSFGTTGRIAPLMLGILEAFYALVRNYGVAILMLTLVVRLVLHPLTRMSQVSMLKTQALQPKLAELQKKHKDDKQKLVQEQIALYRRYGVHPMSGCWPMFLQMPVLIALFVTLRSSVQLRQAAFIPGWINDLSQPDTVWHLPFYLPFLGNELNILPFLMVGVWILNQTAMPKAPDPRAQQQQNMMKWMTIIFAVMFYHVASGLLLYWTASSALGMLEQWLVRRTAGQIKLEPVGQEEPQSRSARQAAQPRKEGFWQRLMLRVQQQQKRADKTRGSRPRKGT